MLKKIQSLDLNLEADVIMAEKAPLLSEEELALRGRLLKKGRDAIADADAVKAFCKYLRAHPEQSSSLIADVLDNLAALPSYRLIAQICSQLGKEGLARLPLYSLAAMQAELSVGLVALQRPDIFEQRAKQIAERYPQLMKRYPEAGDGAFELLVLYTKKRFLDPNSGLSVSVGDIQAGLELLRRYYQKKEEASRHASLNLLEGPALLSPLARAFS